MPTIRLTKASVKALQPTSVPMFFWDDSLPGFGVKVSAGGRKTWVIQYRVGRESKRRSLGSADTIALDRVRRRAGDILAAIRLGEDPFEEEAPSPTFNAVADQFLATVEAKKAPRTAQDYREKLDRHIRPAFGSRPLREISRADIEIWHEGIRRTPRTANYALAVLVAVFTFAVGRGIIRGHEHPARGITKFGETKRQRYLSLEELTAFGGALTDLEAARNISPWAAAALRLLVLTGARSGEILSLTWPMVDLGHARLNLPTSKTGQKSIALSSAAVDVLRGVPKIEGVPWVIAGRRHGEAMTTLQRPFRMVCERAGIAGLRIHDLRHSAASFATSEGVGLPVVGALLGQSQAYTTARYSHIHDDAQRAAAETIGKKAGPLLGRGIGERR
ncbi:MAG: tyrosine-type recombinase/integrase [Bauldia sp.]